MLISDTVEVESCDAVTHSQGETDSIDLNAVTKEFVSINEETPFLASLIRFSLYVNINISIKFCLFI